jgi:hypothetical protein
MKTFKDFTGAEGIDKIVECAPYVTEIIIDTEIMGQVDKLSWLELGAKIIKKHGEAFNKIRFALGNEKCDDSLSLSYSAAQLMKEILNNKEAIDFFTSFPKTEE